MIQFNSNLDIHVGGKNNVKTYHKNKRRKEMIHINKNYLEKLLFTDYQQRNWIGLQNPSPDFPPVDLKCRLFMQNLK